MLKAILYYILLIAEFIITIFIYGTFSYYQIYFFIILKVIVNIGVAIALNGKPLTAIEDIFSHLKKG